MKDEPLLLSEVDGSDIETRPAASKRPAEKAVHQTCCVDRPKLTAELGYRGDDGGHLIARREQVTDLTLESGGAEGVLELREGFTVVASRECVLDFYRANFLRMV